MTEITTPTPTPAPASGGRRPQQMSGVKKAAALMISLDTAAAANVMRVLSNEEREKVAGEILKTKALGAEERNLVLEESFGSLFSEMGDLPGGQAYALKVFMEAFGETEGIKLMERVADMQIRKPFEFINGLDEGFVAGYLAQEHPQTIAIVLANLESRQAAKILNNFDTALQIEVSRRIAKTGDVGKDALLQVEDGIRVKMTKNTQETAKLGGEPSLAALLNQIDNTTSTSILEELKKVDPLMAEEVRKRMFVFDDILNFDTFAMQTINQNVDKDALPKALKGASQELRDKFFSGMSQRAAETMREEMETLRSLTRKQVEEAQDRIVEEIRRLDEAGTIRIPRGDDDVLF